MSIKICLICNRNFDAQIGVCPHDGTALIALQIDDELTGQTLFNTYEILKKVATGSTSLIYMGRHRLTGNIVAVKVLKSGLPPNAVSTKRFMQEANVLSHLSHPSITTIFDINILPSGQPFFVMEYVHGPSLAEEVDTHGALAISRCISIFSTLAGALHYAHNEGVVHRDLKPSDVMFTAAEQYPDRVKLLDFGLAKLMPWSAKESMQLTKDGEILGTATYMSPEQCLGKGISPRSDIYSLGVVMFEALTGRPPFRGASIVQVSAKHVSEKPPSLAEAHPSGHFPQELEQVTAKMLAKSPGDRFLNMAELKDVLAVIPRPH